MTNDEWGSTEAQAGEACPPFFIGHSALIRHSSLYEPPRTGLTATRTRTLAKAPFYLTMPPCLPTREPSLDLAREAVAADVVARCHALCGHDVRFVAAVVEQGRRVERAALARGLAPQALVDQWVERWQATLDALDVACDEVVRTTETRHQRIVQALFLKLFEQGDIYKGTRQGRYCARCEEFAPARAPEAGEASDACPECGGLLAETAAESYLLRVSKWQNALSAHLKANPSFLQPAGHHEAVLRAAAEPGLPDPSVSRARDEWAIPVPMDRAHAVEAWFDGLVSHLTASGYLVDPQAFERTWPPRVQVVSPEAVGTYAFAWPALLMAAGLALPERMVVRGRIELREADSNGSRQTADGNRQGAETGQRTDEPVALAARFGSDALRYALLRAADFTSDGFLTPLALADLHGADVVGRLGRLAEATLGAIERGRGGQVPRPGPLGSPEHGLAEAATGLFSGNGPLIDAFDFRPALDRIWAVVDRAWDYAAEAGVAGAAGEPPKTPQLDTALYVLAETCRLVAHSLHPFLPATAAALRERLGLGADTLTPSTHGQWGVTRPLARIARRPDRKDG